MRFLVVVPLQCLFCVSIMWLVWPCVLSERSDLVPPVLSLQALVFSCLLTGEIICRCCLVHWQYRGRSRQAAMCKSLPCVPGGVSGVKWPAPHPAASVHVVWVCMGSTGLWAECGRVYGCVHGLSGPVQISQPLHTVS
jgi:hypothetical protein